MLLSAYLHDPYNSPVGDRSVKLSHHDEMAIVNYGDMNRYAPWVRGGVRRGQGGG